MISATNPTEVLATVALSEEVAGAPLGDARLRRRYIQIIERMSIKPDASIPEAMSDLAMLEAYYRFMRNKAVDHFKLLEPHFQGCQARCEDMGPVLIAHDTTEFAFDIHDEPGRQNVPRLSKNRVGFYWHASLALTALDGCRVPMGLIASRPFVHASQIEDDQTRSLWEEIGGIYANEKWRWMESVEEAEKRLEHVEQVIHVMDREGDDYETLSAMHVSGYDYVIRLTHDRNIIDGPRRNDYQKLSQVLKEVAWEGEEREIFLSARPRRKADAGHAVRRSRKARMKVRSIPVELRRPDSVKTGDAAATLPTYVVEVLESRAPENEAPVRWLLVTNQPVETVQQMWQVVDWYRARWTIEEFFKALKTGAAYKHIQHKRAETLLAALSAKAVVAWHLLVLRHIGQNAPNVPALGVVSRLQLQILRSLKPKLLSVRPTALEVMNVIARLGGHIPHNGPPGWMVLGRGWRHMREVEKGFRLALDSGAWSDEM